MFTPDLSPADVQTLLTLAQYSATEENIGRVNFQELIEKVPHPCLIYFFIGNVVQFITDEETLQLLVIVLTSNVEDGSAYECFIKIFYKINQENICPGSFPPIKTAPFVLEEFLFDFYFKTTNQYTQ